MERRRTVVNGGNSHNGTSIKGLQLFIADLRSSQHSDDHEKRIQSEIVKIKQHFDSASKKNSSGQDRIGGYQRKKYVAKLAYIYITSNTKKLKDIMFGLEQMMILMRSNFYSEKYMAYMILALLYKHPEVVSKVGAQVIQTLIEDLSSNEDNFVALALNFIGVVGKMDQELSSNDEVVSKVFQILRFPTSAQNLKKRSALSFLTLLKCNEQILTNDPQRKQLWIQRVLSLLDDTHNYRLMLAALPLVEFIAKNIDPTCCLRLLPQLAQILHNCVVAGTRSTSSPPFPQEFKFANVPNPWLITKIVSLLSLLIVSTAEAGNETLKLLHPTNIDPETLGKLRVCVTRAIELGTKQCNDAMERLVLNTVLFSLINFASKLEPSNEAISNSVTALCSLLRSAEINIRYLTLDSLVKLCSLNGKPAIDTVRYQNLDLIFHLLNTESDSSIVRKVVNLLYTFTDAENVKVIVEELFNYISSTRRSTDPTIKSDIAVKVAILTEKYATDTNWFILVSLKLLSLTSSASLNDDEIWQRLCQIVVNNPQLHQVTCEHLIDYLYMNHSSEAIIKAGAFLLADYGNLISEKVSVGDLFNLFTDKYFTVSNISKAMILTTMIKLYRFEPKIESVVIKFFQLELNSLDIELQTRSFEYLNLIQLSKLSSDMALLNTLFAPMPPFNTKTNPLLKRLGNLPFSGGSATLVESLQQGSERDDGITASEKPAPPPSRQSNKKNSTAGISNDGSSQYALQELSMKWEEGFARMLTHKKGVLYNSQMLRVLYSINVIDPKQPSHLKVSLVYINQADWDMKGFSTEFFAAKTGNNPEYVLQSVEAPSSILIDPHKRAEQSFEIVVRKPFTVNDSLIVKIYFSCGSTSKSVVLKLGVGLTNTMITDYKSTSITPLQFVTRWRKLREALGEEGEFTMNNIKLKRKKLNTSDYSSEINVIRQSLLRMGFDVAEQSNIANTLFTSGIIHTKSDGNFGCLMKVKFDEKQGLASITCKTTSPGPLAKYIVECVKYVMTN